MGRHTEGVSDNGVDWTGLLASIGETAGVPKVGLDGEPRRLEGGTWAEIHAVRLTGLPEFPEEMVVRILPAPDSWEREVLVQGHVAKEGFPAPAVRLGSLPDEYFDRAWILMDFVPGRTLIDRPTKLAILRAMMAAASKAPSLMARTMATLHDVNSTAIANELALVEAVGPGLEWFYGRAAAIGDAGLVDRAQRLFASRPAFRGSVLCHGDLHPLNLITCRDRDTLVDWTHAQYDDPHYDLAFTTLAFSVGPFVVPRVIRPWVRRRATRAVERFHTDYSDITGRVVDRERLEWFQRLVGLRIRVEDAERRVKGVTLPVDPARPYLALLDRLGL